jgi:hypothetical protein
MDSKAALSLIALFPLLLSCGESVTEASLVGVWRVDFDASWKQSKDVFLKDTKRGASAYSSDPAEKEKQVYDEIKPILEVMTSEYTKDGHLTRVAMQDTLKGTYSVVKSDAPSFEVEETVGRKMTVAITFQDADTMTWKPTSVTGPTLAMRRDK